MSTELIWQKGNNTAEGTQMFIYEKDYVNESINWRWYEMLKKYLTTNVTQSSFKCNDDSFYVMQ